MKQVILLFSFMLMIQLTYAQNCNRWETLVNEGKELVKKNNPKLYIKAIKKYQAAITDCPSKINTIQPQIIIVFEKIEDLRKEADKQKRIAQEEHKKAEAEKKRAEAALTKTDSLNRQNQKLIDAFYFYDGKFALASDGDEYGFINKDGDVVIDYQYDKAENFDETGFAKVTEKTISFDPETFVETSTFNDLLIDTIGKEYKVAYQLKNLNNLTLALHLSGVQLDSFPLEILKYPQLEIIIIEGNSGKINKFKSLPKAINTLKNLKHLHLGYCQIESIPIELSHLTQLQYLDLSYNQLTNLAGLENLKQLQTLNLSDNQLTKLEGLDNLKQLESLFLSDNQLTSLEGLDSLKQLQYLYLSRNPLVRDELDRIHKILPNCNITFSYKEAARYYFENKYFEKTYQFQEKAVFVDIDNYNVWFNLSFYALLVNKPKKAIEAALKVLELNSEALSVETNLALGYLLDNQYQKAEKIYLKWKGKHFPNDNRTCDEVFLQDIVDLEAAGITHPDLEKVKKLFE